MKCGGQKRINVTEALLEAELKAKDCGDDEDVLSDENALSEKDVNPNDKLSADEMALERAELKKEIDSLSISEFRARCANAQVKCGGQKRITVTEALLEAKLKAKDCRDDEDVLSDE